MTAAHPVTGRVHVPGPGAYNDGCRCDQCRELHRARCAAIRAALAARPREDVPHGTLSGYRSWRCRCRPCTQANTAAGRARRLGAS